MLARFQAQLEQYPAPWISQKQRLLQDRNQPRLLAQLNPCRSPHRSMSASTIRPIRHSARHERFRQSDALRRVFEGVVAKCIATGLVGGEGFSIDASLIRADAGKKKRVPGDQPIAWPQAEEASRAVREYLAVLDAAHNDDETGAADGGSNGSGNR